jgi:hypothetical protein
MGIVLVCLVRGFRPRTGLGVQKDYNDQPITGQGISNSGELSAPGLPIVMLLWVIGTGAGHSRATDSEYAKLHPGF